MSRDSPRTRSTRAACAALACAASIAAASWSRRALGDEAGAAVPASGTSAVALAPQNVEAGTTARVAIRADYEGAMLELRRFGTFGGWLSACAAPCDRTLVVAGMEARVVAPGMTSSKPFRIDPGSGTASLTVNGGSAGRASAGRVSLYIGVPLGFAGMGAFSYGKYDDRQPLVVGGGIALGLGAALVLVALPLIVSGSTEVTNAEGQWIAGEPAIRF